MSSILLSVGTYPIYNVPINIVALPVCKYEHGHAWMNTGVNPRVPFFINIPIYILAVTVYKWSVSVYVLTVPVKISQCLFIYRQVWVGCMLPVYVWAATWSHQGLPVYIHGGLHRDYIYKYRHCSFMYG